MDHGDKTPERAASGRQALSVPTSPINTRRHARSALSQSRRSSFAEEPNERTGLLSASRSRVRILNGNETPRHPQLRRSHSHADSPHASQHQHQHPHQHHSRTESWGQRLIYALSERQDSSKLSGMPDERVWYDQFTSTDWVHDGIADAYRVKALRSRKDFVGRVIVLLDGAQGWVLSALVGFIVACIAYCVNVTEAVMFDWKDGYCVTGWYKSEAKCCPNGPCTDWRDWREVLRGNGWAEYGAYVIGVIVFSAAACWLTLLTKHVVPSAYRLSTFDENLAAETQQMSPDEDAEDDQSDMNANNVSPRTVSVGQTTPPPMVYYSAAGSGVAEVRVILSGFVLHGFLGMKTLVIKSLALILSVASGFSLGKEGPYVHIATCVGNIACRLFSKYDRNDAKRREVLSAAAAAGVAVAFGAPLGGVLFGLEEVAYFFPAKTLFRTFFCCATAALTLKFLNPYGTHKIVMFQIHYNVDWEYFELVGFVAVGIMGGLAGALFIKASKYWAKSFRRFYIIKRFPLVEVLLVAVATALLSYWNVLTKLPVAQMLYNLAAPCDATDDKLNDVGICPSSIDDIPSILKQLALAFLVKAFLTIVTFGLKIPGGIYVPSMVVGGLMGRFVGHCMQWLVLKFPTWGIWGTCPLLQESTCVQPGVYGLIAAGATMCGVTRLSVTLAVILFEITGSLDYVLPFSLAILVAKWVADAVEPLSIYDLLTEMNSYPFLNNKHKPVFTSDLADIVPRVRRERIIDISTAPVVKASTLRRKLISLHNAGELDGGLPIIRNGVLVGLIPAPDLEFALDNLANEETSLCLMASVQTIDDSDTGEPDPTDFTPFIDPAPVALDIKSPMDLVYECFVKLGLRYICVLRDGQYAGMTHKKTFVKYMRDLEAREGHM